MSEQSQAATVAYAPGRVELLGNHTDYNDGVVLGAAINRGLRMIGTRHDDDLGRLHSRDFGEIEISLNHLRPLSENRWANYVFGVTNELIKLGVPVGGFTAEIASDLPAGSGLSSSAALEVSSALLLMKLFPHEIAPLEIAKACQRAENNFVGVKSGLFDQVTSLFGRSNCAVFFDSRTEEVRRVAFPAGLALIIADSGKKRELASGDYNLRRRQTQMAASALGVRALRDITPRMLASRDDLPDILQRRAAHIVGENARVWQALDLLEAGDGVGFGQLMYASHESFRHNFENSTPELDALVSTAQQLRGVLGSRLTGAGFGGATVTLCERLRAEDIAAELSRNYELRTGIAASTFVCDIAGGAV